MSLAGPDCRGATAVARHARGRYLGQPRGVLSGAGGARLGRTFRSCRYAALRTAALQHLPARSAASSSWTHAIDEWSRDTVVRSGHPGVSSATKGGDPTAVGARRGRFLGPPGACQWRLRLSDPRNSGQAGCPPVPPGMGARGQVHFSVHRLESTYGSIDSISASGAITW